FVLLSQVVGTPDVSISNYDQIDTNGLRGIDLETFLTPVGDVTVSGNTVSNSILGQGIYANFTNNAVGSVTMNGNTISDSGDRVLDLVLNGVTGTPNIVVSNTTVTNSGGRGVSVAGVGSAAHPMTLGTITLTNVSSDTTTAEDGVAVVLSSDVPANGKVGDVT